MIDKFNLNMEFIIRHATTEDLSKLEWHGMFTGAREILRNNFARAQKGEIIYLVADLNNFPIGQVQIDLIRRAEDNIAFIWAFRTIPSLQNLGIGSRLMKAAENIIIEKGFAGVELGVGKDNPDAKRLYERLGYQVVKETIEHWSYTTPDGEFVQVEDKIWVMQKKIG